MSNFLFWAIQYGSQGRQYPWDVDFYLDQPAYWDLILNGELWDSYCQPVIKQSDQVFTTNDERPLELMHWRHPRWLPNDGGGNTIWFCCEKIFSNNL